MSRLIFALPLVAALPVRAAAPQPAANGTSATPHVLAPTLRPVLLQTTPAETALRGSRVIKTFDFEETALGNFEDTPMFWSKVVGRGYPAYSTGSFNRTIARSAKTSFMLNTDGGSVAYRYNPPAEKRIPVQPNADYYILAFVKSSALKHARADLAAWFADDQGNLILSTETHAQTFAPTQASSDAWQVLYVSLPGPPADRSGPAGQARSLVVQMGLLQPQQLGITNDKLGPYAIYQQDITGTVWFDDITIFQLPRVGVTPRKGDNSPQGTFAHGEPVELDIQLADLGSAAGKKSHPEARLQITNADGLLFASQTWDIPASGGDGSGWAQHFSHAPLPAGQYTATLDVLDAQDNTLIARRQSQFLSLPEAPETAAPAPDFGLGAAGWTDTSTWADLPMLLRQSGAGFIQLPAWRHDMPDEALTRRDVPLDAMFATLQRQNVRSIGALAELPDPIAAHLNGGRNGEHRSILALLDLGDAWRQYLSFPLTRYANRVDLWELGTPEAPFSSNSSASAAPGTASVPERFTKLYEQTYPEIAGLMSRPDLLIPWNALYEIDATKYPHAMLDLRLPAVIKPSQIPTYLDNFREDRPPVTASGAAPGTPGASTQPAATAAPRRPIIAHLEGLDPRVTARADRLADFAQRLVFAHAAAPETILFDVSPDHPDELFLVYSVMVRALGGSTYAGQIPVGPGIQAHLFKRPGGATLVLWSDTAGMAGDQTITLPLGSSPTMTDLLGNRRSLTVDLATHLTTVPVSSTPIVIQQVEAETLQFAASFGIANPNIPAGEGSLRTEVILKNPFAESITGSLRVLTPKGWTSDPPSFQVSLAAGAELRQEVLLRYPFSEPAGHKVLQARLNLDPGNPTGMREMTLSCTVDVSSDQVEMEGFSHIQPDGNILIQQVITNTTSLPLDGEAFALIPGFPRQQRYIVGLQPGQSTIKRFTFAPSAYVGASGNGGTADEIAKALEGASATLGVRQSDGRSLLTKAIPLE